MSKPKKEKISVCNVMKDDTSKIIQKLESQIPYNFQQYSDLYGAYLNTLEDVFGTCYIAEKEFFDKLSIDQGVLSAYQKYSNMVTETCLNQIEMFSKLKDENIKMQISSLGTYNNFMHTMMESYAKFLSQFNKIYDSWQYSKNF